ncbi:hypothetical protein GCM10027418_19220 [Mariniluteicoccus endophyticus]
MSGAGKWSVRTGGGVCWHCGAVLVGSRPRVAAGVKVNRDVPSPPRLLCRACCELAGVDDVDRVLEAVEALEPVWTSSDDLRLVAAAARGWANLRLATLPRPREIFPHRPGWLP